MFISLFYFIFLFSSSFFLPFYIIRWRTQICPIFGLTWSYKWLRWLRIRMDSGILQWWQWWWEWWWEWRINIIFYKIQRKSLTIWYFHSQWTWWIWSQQTFTYDTFTHNETNTRMKQPVFRWMKIIVRRCAIISALFSISLGKVYIAKFAIFLLKYSSHLLKYSRVKCFF